MLGNRLNRKLLKAVGAQNAAAVSDCLKRGADIETRGEEDFTPLLLAVKNNATEIALLLIANGANVHQVTEFGDAALHWAAKNDNAHIAAQLIEKLADINQLNNRACSPLMICAIFNSLKVAGLLLKKGARLDIVNDQNQDAMHIAAHRDHSRFEQLLLLHSTGETPQWERTGGESVSRRSRLNAETALTEHFDFTAKMYTSIVNGPGGAPSHSRTSFNSVAKPLLAEARVMLRTLSLKAPE
jgi:ankyrin repeat protein